MAQKFIADFTVEEVEELTPRYVRLWLLATDTPGRAALEGATPGSFAQVLVEHTPGVMLRRPISLCSVNRLTGELCLIVRRAGEGSDWIASRKPGDTLNLILPLGKGFTIATQGERCLLVGGGVGVAPLLFLGQALKEVGAKPTFLLGARTASELLLKSNFQHYGPTGISTDDGSEGISGVVTLNPLLQQPWDRVYCCGPAPMMRGVARICRQNGTDCEVSLENMMACGLGACLCCVERTVKGNVCVCSEGPVFNIKQLTWE